MEKIHSIGSFFRALVSPLDDVWEISPLTRVALTIFSTLLIVPMVTYGIVTLVNKIKTKNPDDLDPTSEKTANLGKNVLGQDEKRCLDMLNQAIRSDSAIKYYQNCKENFEFPLLLKCLDKIQPTNEREKKEIVILYGYFCRLSFLDQTSDHVANLRHSIMGMMRFKDTQKITIYEILPTFTRLRGFFDTHLDDKTYSDRLHSLYSDLAQIVQEAFLSIPPTTQEERFERMVALKNIAKAGFTPEQEQWAQSQAQSLRTP